MQLARVERSTAADEVYDQLVQGILGGGVPVGDRLPSERTLADTLGVSRPVVREALKRLAHVGLVRIRHGGSTTVVDYLRTAGPDLLGSLLLDADGNLDLGVARSLVEARSQIGPVVAAAAAADATDGDCDAIEALVADLRAAGDVADRQRIALDFWDAVVDASHNVVHRLLFNTLRRAYEPVMAALTIVMEAEVSDVEGYGRVAAAIRARDEAAATGAVTDLVDHGARATVAVIDRLRA